jgi:transitional endoplasmic reticulum ATPase
MTVRESTVTEITLRVAEALSKDVGRGLARIDPADIERLGVTIGDIVEVRGKRSTAARIMPAFMDQRGKGIVQVDGIVRENAQAGLDETVTLRKLAATPARTVALAPVGRVATRTGPGHADYIARLLEGRPVTVGDRVRIDLLGTQAQEYQIAETQPQGVVVVQPTTQVRLQGAPGSQQKPVDRMAISYEDIGGLDREIQRIREMIELPLRYPEVFERLGIEAPKGVLLYGPPGTGKTLIARAVAYETNATFLHVNGPEVIHKFYGESEQHLRTIFEQAGKKAPSIIFLDELDAIAPKRENTQGEVEKRVVAQLLALMDGLKDRGQVIVIGATNIPNTLDPALRRPGRFDREIPIGIPDRNGRLSILDIHTRGMPLAEDVNLSHLADITHGFVGADLEALCREAAMITLRQIIPNIDFAQAKIPYEQLLALTVYQRAFLEAMNEVEPSAIREVFTEVPDVSWDDVGGLAEIKRTLREAVEWPLKYASLFQRADTQPPKGILLYGPPGCGKTLVAKAVAKESGVNFISIKGPALLSKWVGESERGVREVFKKARMASPCILFLDEIDALAPTRGGGGDSHVAERVVSQLLTEMDGIEELHGVMVLAATNRPDIVDPALRRPGRFDLLVELPRPDEATRTQIVQVHTRRKPLAEDVALEQLVAATQGAVGADIEGVCRQAALLAIREFLEEHPDGAAPERLIIAMRHFDAAIAAALPFGDKRGLL